MTKQQMHDLALVGARQRIVEIEKQLADWHRAFPSLFASPTQPVLLKAELRTNGNGHHVERPHKVKRKRVHWTQTPEGRAKMSRVQKKAWREVRKEGREEGEKT